MKKIPLICLILAFCIGLSYLPAAASDVSVESGCKTLHAEKSLDGSEKKLETADAVILYELNTDTLVYSYNADARINPTGMVKLLTALIAIEQGDLDGVITVKRSTLDTVAIGAVSAGLKAGEQLTLRDLLYCVMVSSANDAAAVIADHLAGSQSAFVDMLNEKATQLGCTGSNFANAHGLAHENQYSTARDLAIIVEAALENPLFTEMFGAVQYTVEATNKADTRKLTTTNYMLRDSSAYYDARVIGGKPAAASTTDRSIICTASVGNTRFLCVVMSVDAQVSEDGLSVTRFGIYEELTVLLDYAFNRFQARQIIDSSQALYQYAVSGGENDVVVRPSKDIYTVLPIGVKSDELIFENIVEAQLLSAPISAGDKLGTLQIRYKSIVIGQCDLLAMHAVAQQSPPQLITDRLDVPVEEENTQWKTILIWVLTGIGVLLVMAVLVLVIIRAVRSARIRRNQRRRARNRKRSRSK